METFNHLDYHVPGLVVAKSVRGAPAKLSVSGSSDVAAQTSMHSDSVFCMGQITETFSAALVLDCVRREGLNIDRSLGQLGAQYKRDNGRLRLIVEEYPQLKPVTVRDLLQHTSGLPSYDQTVAYMYRISKKPKKVWQTEAYLDLITGTDVEYCHGYWPVKRGIHATSSTNYLLIGILLEAVTGSLLSELMTALFSRFSLSHSTYCCSGDMSSAFPDLLAHGYLPVSFPYADVFSRLPVVTYNNSRELRAYDVTREYNLNGLAGMAGVASAPDLLKWVNAIWRDKVFGDPLSVFFEQSATINRDGKRNLAQFGLGFRRAKLYPYGDVVWSKGRTYGYESLVAYSLEKEIALVVAVTSNRSPLRVLTGSELIDDVFQSVFKE